MSRWNRSECPRRNSAQLKWPHSAVHIDASREELRKFASGLSAREIHL
jgi:hypothetical protein